MKQKWSDHERDVQTHLQLICKNNVITYISQEEFPHPRNKPDSSIEIMDQLIVFDAKSPANDDLSNFPKYIKNQTENLKKYAKHANVKNDLFLEFIVDILMFIVMPLFILQGFNKLALNCND